MEADWSGTHAATPWPIKTGVRYDTCPLLHQSAFLVLLVGLMVLIPAKFFKT